MISIFYAIDFWLYKLNRNQSNRDLGRHHCVDEDFYNNY